MSITKKVKFALLFVAGICIGLLLFFTVYECALYFVPSFRQEKAIAPCHAEKNDSLQIECIFRVITKELHKHGIGAAFETFSIAYKEFPPFVQSACHVQAHRVGDIAYYQIYSGSEDLDSMDFPQSTTACGYGFYHGFLEHMIQNHPDPAFITKTCDYFTKRLGKTMGDIEQICYHGSGHGLLLAEEARATKAEWGNIDAYTARPISTCDKLVEANAQDKEQCKEGIFNVLAEWMWTKQNGFILHKDTLFSNCNTVPATATYACYYEMAQKASFYANQDPALLAVFVKQISNPLLQNIAFDVGIASIVQSVIAKGLEYKQIINSCDKLDDAFYSTCVKSIVGGLFEHGEPQQEYKKALIFCTEPSIADHQKSRSCYSAVATRLPRFYAPTQIKNICTEFPQQYQSLCMSETKSKNASS